MTAPRAWWNPILDPVRPQPTVRRDPEPMAYPPMPDCFRIACKRCGYYEHPPGCRWFESLPVATDVVVPCPCGERAQWAPLPFAAPFICTSCGRTIGMQQVYEARRAPPPPP